MEAERIPHHKDGARQCGAQTRPPPPEQFPARGRGRPPPSARQTSALDATSTGFCLFTSLACSRAFINANATNRATPPGEQYTKARDDARHRTVAHHF